MLYFVSTRKVSTVIFVEGGEALSQSQNDKTTNNVMTFSATTTFLLKITTATPNSVKMKLVSLRTADVSPRSSPLKDVSRGGTSVTLRQKFHTDDAKSVRKPVRSVNWSTEQFRCFSYCLRMTDKRQKAAKVKCKRDESLTKQPIFVEYSLL